jgi:hypothetical protein
VKDRHADRQADWRLFADWLKDRRQTDRQIFREKERHLTDGQAGRQTGRQAGRQTGRTSAWCTEIAIITLTRLITPYKSEPVLYLFEYHRKIRRD